MSYTLIKTDKAMKSMQDILHFILYNFDEDTALERIDELEKVSASCQIILIWVRRHQIGRWQNRDTGFLLP